VINVKAIVISLILIVASIAFLVMITTYWGTVGWTGLGIYVVVMIAISGSWILLMGRAGIEKNPLKTMDFALIAMFAALLIDNGSMFIPGLSVLWYTAPMFAGAILAYFPMGIVIAAALKMSPKPGSAFTLFFVYQILGQLFSFNPLWLGRSVLLALGLEAYYISSKRGTMSSLLLMGLMFGVMVPSSSVIFMIYSWGFWQPLFTTIPAAIASGIAMTIGSYLGYALGERAKTVMY